MANIQLAIWKLLRDYKPPKNRYHHYVCTECGYQTRRGKRKWFQYLKQYHEKEYNLLVQLIHGGKQAVDEALGNISSEEEATSSSNPPKSVNDSETNQSIDMQSTSTENQVIKNSVAAVVQLTEAYQNGYLNHQEYFKQLKEIAEKQIK
ncbi:unnamed protein product [Rotaria socialis]|uniref:Uncharacterized protein n=1 Tax=Rotaria socialis TaxID=392032 RepID=A0A818ZV68_9BILA|nr:unnamed protein product [Rotaria socialis]CAF4621570.1 unnamed protein product [Rotaria socialis]